MTEVVIVDALRSPMGRSRAGVFRNVRADKLSASLMQAILRRTPELDVHDIEDVIWGCVSQTLEQGFNIARFATILAGMPHEIPSQTVNRLCGSSMTAIHMAATAIKSGIGDVYLCGGVEHMGHVPMSHGQDLAPELSMTMGIGGCAMGLTAELIAKQYKISRQRQDEFAAASHQRAHAAQVNGDFANEMVALPGNDGNGLPIIVDFDEVVRPETNARGLGRLRPAFNPAGSVTAGNSSALSDGAAATLLMSADKAKSLGLKPLARIVSWAASGCEPSIMGRGPVPASRKALQRAGLSLADMEYIELNEAFAAQSLAVLTELDLLERMDRVNVKGGAIALGHPLGCSGARITGSLAHTLRQKDAQFGLATMCIGLGQGVATVLERLH